MLILGPSFSLDNQFPKLISNSQKSKELFQLAQAYQTPPSSHERQDKVQQEMITIQIKYQREIDRLEKELQSLKKQLLLKQDRNANAKKQRKIKVYLNISSLRLVIQEFLSLEIINRYVQRSVRRLERIRYELQHSRSFTTSKSSNFLDCFCF